MNITANQIIAHYNMTPLPEEGGWYVETYRAKQIIDKSALPNRYNGERTTSTAILYLITPDTISKMHRVKSDEIFCYHLGDPAQMLWLNEDGSTSEITIGPDILNGQTPQVIVPHGTWQGTRLPEHSKHGWCLMSCIVAPGFEFADYEHGQTEALLTQWPTAKDQIIRLT